tara:strand:- start:394 stop:807 length:414 start_codon:yes stop_codon:yes gene_type:complete
MNSKIKKYSKIISSNASIYEKIYSYKYRGELYLKKELFIESIYDFTQNINLSNKVNKTKKRKLFTRAELGKSYFYRGYAFAKVSNFKKAIEDFDKAIKKYRLYSCSIDFRLMKRLEDESKEILEKELMLLTLFPLFK